MFAYAFNQHVKRHDIFSPFRDDNIRPALARFYKLFMHRLYRCQILVNHAV